MDVVLFTVNFQTVLVYLDDIMALFERVKDLTDLSNHVSSLPSTLSVAAVSKRSAFY